jgi:asparagine synthase (glutamine-hydrolysing)
VWFVTINKTGSFRHTETYSFVINRENELKTLDPCLLKSEDGSLQVFIDGSIYDKTGNQLLEGFHQEGANYVTQLEGSFIIFLLKDLGFYILTDKLNTKKAFYTSMDGEWHISTNIDQLPIEKCPLNLDGLACFLANGALLNGLTLFQSIHVTQGAGIHRFSGGMHTFHRYWNYKFSYPPCTPELEEELSKQLEQLLIDCIRHAYEATSHPVALSLSAGYDSRGILGIFHNYLKIDGLSCFSYATNETPGLDTDASLARKIAESCGVVHRLVKSYHGDLLDLLNCNAREGQCLAPFCEELDAWHSMARDGALYDIFSGDEIFGNDDVLLRSNTDVLISRGILDSSAVEWLKGFLFDRVYQDMCSCLDNLNANIIEKVSDIADLFDRLSLIAFYQRENYVLKPWREHMTSQAGFVHNPYLDGKILEFMMKVPPQLRRNKYLFTKTIMKMLPDLYSIPKAKSSGYSVNWRKELVKHRNALIELIQSTDSRLDELVSKDQMIAILDSQSSSLSQLGAFFRRGIKYLRRKFRIADQLFNFVLGPGFCKQGGFVSPEKLMIRLLLMRIYLSPASSKL